MEAVPLRLERVVQGTAVRQRQEREEKTMTHSLRNITWAAAATGLLVVTQACGGDDPPRSSSQAMVSNTSADSRTSGSDGCQCEGDCACKSGGACTCKDGCACKGGDAACACKSGGAEVDTIGDDERLRELVGNLALNAIEASPAGGTVRVTLRLERGPEEAQRAERFTREVADEGPGIPPEERELVLRPFHSAKPNGMGLGLALAQRPVEDHGGVIEIDAAPGGGALLRASWPRTKP